ncbi:hypothetical protein I4U23_022860 [Adineta vaga]|nr:hypothetical protein I4U23_022860 [Adineta vaga]
MTSTNELIASESSSQQELPSKIKISTWNTFKHHIPRIFITATIDMFIPLLIYFILEHRIKPVYALLIAGTPPFLMVICKALWERSLDAIGLVVCVAFFISAMIAVLLNNPLILLFEKSLITGVGAVAFAITLIPSHYCCSNKCQWHPLVYYFYHDLIPVKRTEFGLPDSLFNNNQYTELTELNDNMRKQEISQMREASQVYSWLYQHCSSFRTSCYFMTVVWAVAFSIDFIIRFALVMSNLSVNTIYIWGQITFCITTIVCAILQIFTMLIERKHTLAFIEQWKIEHLTTPSR